MRPSIIATAAQNIDFVIGLWPLFRRIECAVRTKGKTLRVAVAIGEDMTPHAVEFRIVGGYGTFLCQAQRFADIGRIISSCDLSRRWQALGFRWQAPICQLVVPHVADRVIEHAVLPKFQPSGVVVRPGGQSFEQRFLV